jgi:hypothetical protein
VQESQSGAPIPLLIGISQLKMNILHKKLMSLDVWLASPWRYETCKKEKIVEPIFVMKTIIHMHWLFVWTLFISLKILNRLYFASIILTTFFLPFKIMSFKLLTTFTYIQSCWRIWAASLLLKIIIVSAKNWLVTYHTSTTNYVASQFLLCLNLS